MIPLQDLNPTRARPYVTWLLIGVNVVVFVAELVLDDFGNLGLLLIRTGVVPAKLSRDPLSPLLLTVISSMFLHGGWAHLMGNMLYLWIFGDNVEDRLGHLRFLAFYLLGGAAAAAAHTALFPRSWVPMVGASGAIAAVLGAYLLEFPRARVRSLLFLGFFVRLVYIPAVLVIGFWFVLQFFSGVLSLAAARMGNVAYFAHMGGFLAGLFLVKLFAIGRPKSATWGEWGLRQRRGGEFEI